MATTGDALATELAAVEEGQLGAADRLARQRAGPTVIGVDEAGRGPMAGPLVAAAVAWRGEAPAEGLDDSKRLTASARQRLAEWVEHTLPSAVCVCDADVIDRIGVDRANEEAMRRAVGQLHGDVVLVDGYRLDAFTDASGTPRVTARLVRGDQRSVAVAAASILAKTTRDRIMDGYDRIFPRYGVGRHKGYQTPAHLRALHEEGPSPIHRRSWAPVRNVTE